MTRARCLLVALLVASAGWMAWLAVYQVDDAFIVYRYARNLARGDGFVFNPGERVEGVTCFLWTVALTPFAAAGLSLPRVAPVLTAIAGLTCLVLVARCHAESEGRAQLGLRDLLPPTLLAVTPAFAYWSVGALETVPYALLLTLAARQHAQERRGVTGFASAVWLGIANLVRPETPLVVALFAADRARTHRLAATVKWLGIVAAFVGPFLLFRRWYFGTWLPNTYYAKTGARFSVQVEYGWAYMSRCLASLVPSFGGSGDPIVLLGWLTLAALLVFAWRRPTLRSEAMVVLAVAVAIIVEGGDWMVLSRFWVPALPCLAVIAAAAVLRLSLWHRVGTAAATLLVAAVVGSGLTTAVRERNGERGLVVNAIGYRHAHQVIGRYLNEHGAPGDVVALMDVGLIGWIADRLRVIDITGLTDRDIARAPGAFLNKFYAAGELLARDPRFIVLVEGFPADQRIALDPAFRSNYTELFSVDHRFNWTPPNGYRLHVFERETRPYTGGSAQ
jgi:arabinofuranosyltransferase